MSGEAQGVIAAYRHVDEAAQAIRSLKEMGYADTDFTVFTPVPNVEIQTAVDHKVSPVRLWTLIGGLTGVTAGFGMAMWMSYDYPIVVGGKPLGSWIPYVVIGFELTILIGALATVSGLVFHIWRTRKRAVHDPRFTNDHIGVFVACPIERRGAVETLLRSSGADEVRFET
jgi:hypothetical protein